MRRRGGGKLPLWKYTEEDVCNMSPAEIAKIFEDGQTFRLPTTMRQRLRDWHAHGDTSEHPFAYSGLHTKFADAADFGDLATRNVIPGGLAEMLSGRMGTPHDRGVAVGPDGVITEIRGMGGDKAVPLGRPGRDADTARDFLATYEQVIGPQSPEGD